MNIHLKKAKKTRKELGFFAIFFAIAALIMLYELSNEYFLISLTAFISTSFLLLYLWLNNAIKRFEKELLDYDEFLKKRDEQISNRD